MEQKPMTVKEIATFQLLAQSISCSDTRTKPIRKQKQQEKQDSCSRMLQADDPLVMYEQNIGTLRPITRDLLKAWCIERGEDVVMAAIELAVKRGGWTFRYIEEILKEWARADITTLEQLKAYEQKCGPRGR